jgi:hypothetical protein
MDTTKRKVKTLALCGLFISFYSLSNAQDYYGGGNGGSWRKKQDNNQSQPKDKDANGSEPSGYISVNFGFGTPEGNYAQPFSQNTYSEAIGTGYGNFAEPGTVLHLSAGIPINHSNFGIALMFGSYTNQYDLNNYVNNLNSSLNNPNVNANPYTNSPIVAYYPAGGQNVYDESSIMGGLYVTYPFGRFSFDGRLMLGALLNSMPEQAVDAIDGAGDYFTYDLEPSNSTSLAYDVGVGIRFMVAQLGRRKVCLMANIDYLYSNAPYNTQQDLYVVPSTGTNAGEQLQLVPSPQVSGSTPIQLLNITFGIGYEL